MFILIDKQLLDPCTIASYCFYSLVFVIIALDQLNQLGQFYSGVAHMVDQHAVIPVLLDPLYG